MSLQSLQITGGLPSLPPSLVRDAAKSQHELPFADLVKSLVEQTDRQQIAAEQSVTDLVTGEADSVHDVVLTASRADLAFRLMMEIRNRLITSYQEVMRMQI